MMFFSPFANPAEKFPHSPGRRMDPSAGLFQSFHQPDTTQRRQQLVADLEQRMLFGQPPRNIAQGLTSLGEGLALGIARQNAAFPTVPGGAQPSLMTGLANFFTGSHTGGLY